MMPLAQHAPQLTRATRVALVLAALAALAACQKADPAGEAALPTPAPAPMASVTSPAQVPVATASAAPGEAATHGPGAAGLVTGFHATGFSPAWSVDVQGDELRIGVPDLAQPDAQPVVVTARHLAYAKGVNFEGEHRGVPFVLDIRSGPCDKATEAGQSREFHATFTYGKSRYSGCADARR